jgi:protein-S-isoprenylcysteine O-methyltransferase Ste14
LNVTPTSAHRPNAILQLGPLKLEGGAAVLALVVLAALLATAIVASHPSAASVPMWASAGLWIAFITYWSIEARGAARTKSAEAEASRRFHVRLLNTSFLLLLLPIPFLRERAFAAEPALIAAGFAVQVASGVLGVRARRVLGRNWSGAITVAENHELIRTGPYRVVRHPIYGAMLGMFAGTAIVSGELHALLGVLLLAAAYARKIRLEEASLRALFGAAYTEYARATRALIPFLL